MKSDLKINLPLHMLPPNIRKKQEQEFGAGYLEFEINKENKMNE